MTKSRQWIAGTALVAVVVLVAGMFLFVQPRRSQASALRGQTATQDAANQALQNKIATLKAQQQDLPNQQAILDTIRQQLPQTPNLPSLVRSLTDLAKASGVELVALAPSNPQALVQASAPASGNSSSAPSASGSSSDSAASSSTGSTTSGSQASAGGATGVQQIPLKISVIGSYAQLTQFLTGLESSQRALKVLEVAVAPASSSGATTASKTDLQMDLSALAFMAPKSTAPNASTPGSSNSSNAPATNSQ